MPRRKTTEEIIKKCKFVHGNKYGYSKVEYVNSNTPFIIICKKHGEFKKRSDQHIKLKQGCNKCIIDSRKMSINHFIKKSNEVHNHKYNYDNVVYVNSQTKVIITCSDHGDFEQNPRDHIHKKSGCPKCANKGFSRMAIEWLQEIEQTKKIKLRHALHKQGEFRVTYKDNNNRNRYYYIDGYHVATKTIYEFHGDMWHGNPKIYNPEDVNRVSKVTYGMLMKKTLHKEMRLRNMGYKYVCIWESEYKK